MERLCKRQHMLSSMVNLFLLSVIVCVCYTRGQSADPSSDPVMPSTDVPGIGTPTASIEEPAADIPLDSDVATTPAAEASTDRCGSVDRTCRDSSATVCSTWSPAARCESGRNFTFCVVSNSTMLTREYSSIHSYTSIAHPQLQVPVSSNPRLCYAITQLRLTSSGAVTPNAVVDLTVDFDGTTLLFRANGTSPDEVLHAFIQVCCHDYQCFDIASLLCASDDHVQYTGQPFTLTAAVAVSPAECLAPPLLDNGVHDCDGQAFTIGSTCRYTCSRGYSLAGSNAVKCQASGNWSPDPPRCSVLQYTIPTRTVQIGETNSTGFPSHAVVAVTIPEPLSQDLRVPVQAGSLPVSLTPSDGLAFTAGLTNQTKSVTLASTGDNQLLENFQVSGKLTAESAIGSAHYSGFPRQSSSIDVTIVDNEPYVAEFILAAAHQTASDTFMDSARQIGETSPSSQRFPINETSSSAQRLPVSASGTLSPTFSCDSAGKQSSPLVQYSDRHAIQQLSSSAFSIDVWVKLLGEAGGQEQQLLQYGSAGSPQEVSLQFQASSLGDGHYEPQLCIAGFCWRCVVNRTADVLGEVYTAAIAPNEWRHVAFAKSLSPSSPQVTCFVDGVKRETIQLGTGPDGPRANSTLRLCTHSRLEFDLLRLVVGESRFSSATIHPFSPPHQQNYFACPPLRAPVQGKISCSGYTVGGLCTVSCSPGYSLQHAYTAQRTCTSTGTWSGFQSVCVPLVITVSIDTAAVSAKSHLTGYPSTAQVTVSLASRIDDNVEVPIVLSANSPSNLLKMTPSNLTFTPDNWQIGQFVHINVLPADQRLVYSPTEQLQVVAGPATGSGQYRGFPAQPAVESISWVNSELYSAAFYLFSPWFSTDTSFEAHSTTGPLQNTTIHPGVVISMSREPMPPAAIPRLAVTSTIQLTQPYYVSYPDRSAFRIGSRAFHLDFWAAIPAGLSFPIIHYSGGATLSAGISDLAGFSVSLTAGSVMLNSLLEISMQVCIAGDCATCVHSGQANAWRHFTVSRDGQSATRCFINGRRSLWNRSTNLLFTKKIDGASTYSLQIGGDLPTTQTQFGTGYIELVRLYVEPESSSLTALPLLPGELSLLDCGLVTSVGTHTNCTSNQGLLGDICRVDCVSGRIVGHAETYIILNCSSKGQWNPDTIPACQLDCPTLRIPNASPSCGSDFTIYTYGSTCSVNCHRGAQLVGSNGTLFCQSGGMWSDPDVMCAVPTPPSSAPPQDFVDGE
eukprot:scpid19401/ scgid2845/ Sushi, von Willebrand factor type A, EGF and pentraxin domain-containing protein 1